MALYNGMIYFIQILKNAYFINFVLEVNMKDTYEGITGLTIQHWRYWSRIQIIKKNLTGCNWTVAHIHPSINKVAEYIVYQNASIKTNTHHFNNFVGILKFDAISYPYAF
ncbi:unnamed protein product [Cuscuta europaea]|uniref:Uncharacterized protein n=1 Tax=Cuscuta europaea TaxID=41803 RepID=A0A9P0ZPP8_CUSEU|nr:unnamed protein product [Cuscuta europaea]